MSSYQDFLKAKIRRVTDSGFEMDPSRLNAHLFDFQRFIVAKALKAGRFAVFADCGLGKCHGIDTPILMHDGYIKKVQDIRVGECLMGNDGTPRKVLSLARGREDMYRIELKNGDFYTCNASHILSLKVSNKYKSYKKGEVVNMELREWLTLPDYAKRNCFKHYKVAVDFPSQPVPMDAYLFGAWLGDGSRRSLTWTINDKDTAIVEKIMAFAKDKDLHVREKQGQNCKMYFLTRKIRGNASHCDEFEFIRNYDTVKRISPLYLQNDRQTRLQLLAGIIDTDGHLIDKCYEISTKWQGLQNDILYLCRSLGLSVSHREKVVNNTVYYRIFISGNTDEIPCITRKKCEARKQIKTPLVYGFDVYKQGRGDYYGFEIDGNHLYLLGDFTVTHNTLMQLSWAYEVVQFTEKPVLILCPLAVAGQTIQEGAKFGIGVVKYNEHLATPHNDDIFIANYEQLENIDVAVFAGVVLDESSILKNFTGATKKLIIEKFKDTPYKLACTATPSPNDLNEIGNHSEFLGVLDAQDMRAKWFVRDEGMNNYRLKQHAKADFYGWIASWAVMLSRPSDIGFSADGYDLPPLNCIERTVLTDRRENWKLFNDVSVNATNFNRELRLTKISRLSEVIEIVNGNENEPFLIWIKQNDEADYLLKNIEGALEVRGDMDPDLKEKRLLGFARGEFRVLITKTKIAQFGLNFQNCSNQIFASLDFSFEGLYQAIRRSYRFGQTKPVNTYLITTDTMENVLASVKAKQAQFEEMRDQMSRQINHQTYGLLPEYDFKEVHLPDAWLMKGDSCQEIRRIADNSVDFIVFSPPFSSLFTYSNYIHDMGNNENHDEFFRQYAFLLKELYRILKPGRLMACHTKDLGVYKNSSGYTGIYPFTLHHTMAVLNEGFKQHCSPITIWCDPVLEMQRTKTQRLLYKTVTSDSTFTGTGMAEYITVFRKWEGDQESWEPVTNLNKQNFPLETWQKWASPVWMDIKRTDVLNGKEGTDMGDEKHIAPLQLEVIHRLVNLYTNKGETVFTPFLGIGSEAYVAVKNGRRAIGIELKDSYFDTATINVKSAGNSKLQLSIFQ